MVYCFLADGFEEVEAIAPVDMLRRAGVEVKTVGVTGEVIDGRHGIKVIPDIDIEDINQAEIMIVGGATSTIQKLKKKLPNCKYYEVDKKYKD